MANRNRSAGILWELEVIKDLHKLGFEAVSTRYASRMMDDQGIDILSDFPLKIQCKVSINQPNVHKILTETEAELIFYKRVEKSGSKFMPRGEYVIMRKEVLYKILLKNISFYNP